jgi:hypothetical protein
MVRGVTQMNNPELTKWLRRVRDALAESDEVRRNSMLRAAERFLKESNQQYRPHGGKGIYEIASRLRWGPEWPHLSCECSTIYLIRRKGPLASAKLLVFKTCIPALWSPSNGVAVPGHPALVASVGSANQIPRSSSSTGTAGVPGFRMKVSSLKIPVTFTTPLPRALVVRSPWYHAAVKGAFGVLMTNSVKSVFEQLTCEKSAEIRSRQNAL